MDIMAPKDSSTNARNLSGTSFQRIGETGILIVCGILVSSIFVLDILLPIGYLASILYAIPVLICIWSPNRWTIFIVAGISSVLTIAAVPLKPTGDIFVPLFNRPLSLIAIWLAAFLTDRYITEMKNTEGELTRTSERLITDLDAMKRLHQISMLPVRGNELSPVLAEVLDAAIFITHSDTGFIQLWDRTTSHLDMKVQRGFDQTFLTGLDLVHNGKAAPVITGHRGERVLLEDITKDPIPETIPEHLLLLKAGVRSVQLSPLMGGPAGSLGCCHAPTSSRKTGRECPQIDRSSFPPDLGFD